VPRPAGPRTTRRAVLALTLTTALTTGLSGCGVRWVTGTEPTPTPERDADDLAREATVEEALTLLTSLEAAATGADPLRAVASQAADTCRSHLAALGSPAVATTPGVADPVDAQAVVDALVATATSAFVTATATQNAPGGPVARLVASVATSRALLADTVAVATGAVVGEFPPPSPTGASPTTSDAPDPETATDPGIVALQAVLDGEHAAVHGFALVQARLAEPRRSEAAADLAGHRVARDDLTDLLEARGATPDEALPGYDVEAGTADSATALAATMDERLSTLWAAVVAASAPDRDLAARQLVEVARQARRWGSQLTAFPGMPEVGTDGLPTTTP
jgi:hypothetical protein